MLHIDDLIEPRPEQILLARPILLAWSHRSPPDAARESRIKLCGNPKTPAEIASFRAFKRPFLANPIIAVRQPTPAAQSVPTS
jgi:hypothetical protein